MTAPMPETMSPREKVAAVLDPEIWADDMPVPTRAAVTDFHARRQASVIKADAILAALASSGDHAELTRWAKDWPNYSCTSEVVEAVLALIAEVAALRSDKWEVQHTDTMNDMVLMGMARDDAETRATEAERKLAEAESEVQRWKSAYDIAHEQAMGNGSEANALRGKLAEAVGLLRDFLPWSRKFPDLKGRITTFLSKEAERG